MSKQTLCPIIDLPEFQKHAATHHSPRSVSQLAVLSKAANNLFDELVIVVVASTKQDLADYVGGRIMKHAFRAKVLACKRKNKVCQEVF